MISTFAHTYIHLESVGNFDSCKQHLNTIGDAIQALYDEKKIAGFQAAIIENDMQESDELIPSFKENADEKYPYLFFRVQAKDGGSLDIDAWMAGYGVTKIH